MLSLEDAIAHYLKMAEENEKDAEQFKRIKATQDMISHCYECAEEYRQLADWLRKLKAYEEARKEINGLATVWKEAEGINKCRRILFKHLEEVNANEDKHIRN